MSAEHGRRFSPAHGCDIPSGGYVAASAPNAATLRLQHANVPPKDVLPPALTALLHATDDAAGEAAWSQFVSQYSRIILGSIRRVVGEHDGAMDAYAHLLEQMREHDYRRLRLYEAQGNSRFTTWLVVVVLRLTHDFSRKRYGRLRGTDQAATADRATRRRLVDLVATNIDLTTIEDQSASPDSDVRRRELVEALRQGLNRLTPDERLMLHYAYDDGLNPRQIAEVLQLRNKFLANRQLHAILKKLRAWLSSRGIDDAGP